VIHDTNYARVGGRFVGKEWKRGLAAADEEHVLAHACANGIDRDERPAGRFAVGRDGLKQKELVAVQARIFDGRDDVSDDTSELHFGDYF
jgi:hypothetical protein